MKEQLYSANKEVLLSFCMLMDETVSMLKWLINMHYFCESQGCVPLVPAGVKSQNSKESVRKAGRLEA